MRFKHTFKFASSVLALLLSSNVLLAQEVEFNNSAVEDLSNQQVDSFQATPATGNDVIDRIRECVVQKKRDFEAMADFNKRGRVQCRPGQIVGFPPRCKRYDNSATVRYVAPTGWIIKGFPSVRVISSNRGSNGGVSSNAREARVGISCRGHGCDFQGRAWQEVDLVGKIQRKASADDVNQFWNECIKTVTGS